MWVLRNATPLACQHSFVADRQGFDTYVVAVKGTFDILADGRLALAEAQLPVAPAPSHADGDPGASLLCECELDYTKPGTDVLVHGAAHAPGGRPVESLEVRLVVGPIDKTVRVTGDRTWLHGHSHPVLERPAPFTTMPIRYERAFGGADLADPDPSEHDWETRNPIGCGFVKRAERIPGCRAPNLEYPDDGVRLWSDRVRPAGLGPIPRHWAPRRHLAGTYDDQWQKTRAPLWPTDFDDRFFLAAPTDQQAIPHLAGGEPVTVTHMHPDGTLNFRLPRARIVCTTRIAGRQEEYRPVMHTVAIMPERRELVITWHAALRCHGERERLAATEVRLKRWRDKG